MRLSGSAFFILGFAATSEYADTGLSSVWYVILKRSFRSASIIGATASMSIGPRAGPPEAVLALTSYRSESANGGSPTNSSLLLVLNARLIRNRSGKPSATRRPPGCIWYLPILELGSVGLIVATSNSVGAGIGGSASATPGGFSVG